MDRTLTVPLVFLAALLTACEDPQVRDVKARLVGTWVAESMEHGGVARRVLTLEASGHAKETVRITASGGASASESREGEWSFDGVNLKRRYTHVDGKPLTNAHFIYQTHELKSVTDTELVASSNVGRGEMRLRRKESAARQ